MTTDLRITLAPSGDLRLILPSGRTIDCGENVEAIRTIKRILRNADDPRPRPGHIGSFPTQAVVNAWRQQDLARQHREAVKETETLASEIGLDLSSFTI